MELVDADINAYRANKKIQLEERVKILRQYDLYIHEDSQNLINEADAWKYQERNGIVIPYPDQKCEDHGMDAGAYGTISLIR